MERLDITSEEFTAIDNLLENVGLQYQSVESPEFLSNCRIIADELPRRLRAFLNDFRLLEPEAGVCVVSGYVVDYGRIGHTPSHWKEAQSLTSSLKEEIYLMLLGSLLGDSFGWSTQQDGRMVHDVLPIKAHEAEQLGTGSTQLLWWHNEDAFHPVRGDYLGMMCLRNPDQVATMIGTLDIKRLSRPYIDILFESRFMIRPDESHQEKNMSASRKEYVEADELLQSAYARISQMNSRAEKVAVLEGDPQSPYLRLDPYFMDPLVDDEEAQNALNQLVDIVESSIWDLVLQPGDCCFIDNFKAVHGRRPFKAHYDGTDRWLKRINLTRDLRKSKSFRKSPESRIIY